MKHILKNLLKLKSDWFHASRVDLVPLPIKREGHDVRLVSYHRLDVGAKFAVPE